MSHFADGSRAKWKASQLAKIYSKLVRYFREKKRLKVSENQWVNNSGASWQLASWTSSYHLFDYNHHQSHINHGKWWRHGVHFPKIDNILFSFFLLFYWQTDTVIEQKITFSPSWDLSAVILWERLFTWIIEGFCFHSEHLSSWPDHHLILVVWHHSIKGHTTDRWRASRTFTRRSKHSE